MFFGRKPEPEKVTLTNLIALLNQAFDKKLGNFESRVFGITKELNSLKGEFNTVCNEFEALKAEPFTEDLWNPNVNSIKSQKTAYSSALRNVIAQLSLDTGEGPNAYTKYKLILINVEEATGSILRYNSNYKIVLYCYSNHLKGFKRTFSNMERLRDMLKNEIDTRIEYYNAYNSIMEQISKLNMGIEEIKAAQSGIAAIESNLDSADGSAVDKSEADAAQKVQQKISELSKINAQISEIQNKVNLLAAPLNRVSKKFDHMSERKRHISNFIADPISEIRDESEYREFVGLLQDLKASVEAGKVDVKNSSEITNAISRLIESNVYNSIASLNSIKLSKYDLEGEIRELERIHSSIKAAKDGKAKSGQQIENLKAEAKKIAESQQQLKASIEKSFSENYSKPISIVME